METFAALRRQIHSAEELQSVVKSMKAISAASIWRHQRAVELLSDYERTVELGLQILLGAQSERIEIEEPPLHSNVGAIVLGTDQGMVGNFNDEITRFTLDQLDSMELLPEERTLIVVGRRVRNKLQAAGERIALSLRMPTSIDSIRPAVQQLMIRVGRWREEEQVGRIMIFHNAPARGTRYRSQRVQLIPVNLGWLRLLQEREWESTTIPTFDMAWDDLFTELIQEFLYIAVFSAFTASLAAENASRLSSMEAAERNIEERLDDLEQRYHQLRQQAITSELLDIVAGAEATSG